jgi:hypothetical protein
VLLAALVLPSAARALAAHRLHRCAERVVAALRSAQFQAVSQQESIAIEFATAEDGGLRYALQAPPAASAAAVDWRRLEGTLRVHLGLPNGRLVRDPSAPERYLTALVEALHASRANTVSFEATGVASALAAIYLTDGDGLVVIRIDQGGGVARIESYDFARDSWR